MTFEPSRKTRYAARRKSFASAVTYEDFARANAMPEAGLLAHMRRLRRRNQGSSRWLALAVLAGSVVAFAVINFLAR